MKLKEEYYSSARLRGDSADGKARLQVSGATGTFRMNCIVACKPCLVAWCVSPLFFDFCVKLPTPCLFLLRLFLMWGCPHQQPQFHVINGSSRSGHGLEITRPCSFRQSSSRFTTETALWPPQISSRHWSWLRAVVKARLLQMMRDNL